MSLPVSQTGPITEGLDSLNVPYASTVADLTVFVGSFLLVYLLGRIIIRPLFNRALNARGLDAHAKRPLQKLVNFAVFFLAVTVAFGLAGFGSFLQALATIGAAATLAIGLALQDVIRNFAAGIFIFTDRPFRIGDWIEWNDNTGIVEDISLRVTRIRTFDNELLTVPNGELMGGPIKNPVDAEQLRLKFVFGIGYNDDIDAATEIIIEEAESNDEILTDPGPTVRLVELGDSSVGLQSRVWIGDPTRSDLVRVRSEYVQAVKERFDAAGIDIPYPNRTIGGGLEIANVEGVVEPTND
jgi:Small-conductance mechanosensitive channel